MLAQGFSLGLTKAAPSVLHRTIDRMNFCMLRFVKQTFLLLAVLIGCQSAFGFALIGPTPPPPSDAYQTPALSYNPGGAEFGTPRNLHEEYRRNTPIVYYAFDQSWWEYFGEAGIAEIEKAMAMYNSIGKVSQVDPNDYPLDSRRVNFRAAADGLYDLKSFTMGLMTYELGLFEPSRWVWSLNTRTFLGGPPPCPANMQYELNQLNFNPFPVSGTDTYPTTTYVNGALYSYYVLENCVGVRLADAIEVPVDVVAEPYSAVADFVSLDYAGLAAGGFYTTFTKDDVAGLKYLYNTNNINNEASGARVTEFITNSTPTVVQTQDLGVFAAQARVSTAAQLIALYPGLIVNSTTTNVLGFAITTNITLTLVSHPLDPAGLLPSHPVLSTNYTTNIVTLYDHTYGNIVTNSYSSRGIMGILTLNLVNPNPYAPAGTVPVVTTNNTLVARPLPVTGVFGDFFILPAGVCRAQILSNILTTVVATTNQPTAINPAATNAVTFTPGSITFATNHLVVYFQVNCPVDSVDQRGGVDRIIFIRRDYDTIGGQAWDPITNDYTVTEFQTNRTLVLRHFQRRVPRPDLLFSTGNFSSAGSTFAYTNVVDGVTNTTPTTTVAGAGASAFAFTGGYNQAGRDGHKAGPGTIIDPPVLSTIIIYNRVAPDFTTVSSTTTNNFLYASELTQTKLIAWGSFDGTTNAPIVYPNETSLTELENQLIGPAATTRNLPNGEIGAAYSAQLSAFGGAAPYTWTLAPGSPGLPSGLNLTPDGQITGTPDGPASIYDFTVRLTDANGVFVNVQYTITIF
jgi:hypothetical protein